MEKTTPVKYLHNIDAEQLLPISLDEAWRFFSSPKNLEKITPPHLDFKILSQNLPQNISNDLLIEYRIRPLLGIPIRWVTKIQNVIDRDQFTDIQLKGPYAIWVHTHSFLLTEQGILMRDKVIYKLPLGFLGEIVHKLFIRKKIERIFTYRKSVLDKLFLP